MPRILLVTDDGPVRLTIRTLLKMEGYEVIVADSYRSGIEAITCASFDALVVDISGAGVDGPEFIKVFRRHAPRVPIIAMGGLICRHSGARPAEDLR
jgi:two-component system nitrogen regulation response regulator NtrX